MFRQLIKNNTFRKPVMSFNNKIITNYYSTKFQKRTISSSIDDILFNPYVIGGVSVMYIGVSILYNNRRIKRYNVTLENKLNNEVDKKCHQNNFTIEHNGEYICDIKHIIDKIDNRLKLLDYQTEVKYLVDKPTYTEYYQVYPPMWKEEMNSRKMKLYIEATKQK